MNFENYLKEQGFTTNTIESHRYNIEQFKAWLDLQNIEETKVTYGDITTFISYLKEQKKNQIRTINHKLNSLRKYFDYLKIIPNPANNIYLKGQLKTIPQGLLNERELQLIYKDYTTTSTVNKIILGLIIYQGIGTGEISKSIINIENRTLQIQGSKRSNPRVLTLHQNQIELLKKEYKDLSALTNQSINNRLQKILKRIKKSHPKVKNTRQLRASRITLWLKDYNLRQVQYMAGHRYVSSTEKYQTTDLQSLARSIEKYHPS